MMDWRWSKEDVVNFALSVVGASSVIGVIVSGGIDGGIFGFVVGPIGVVVSSVVGVASVILSSIVDRVERLLHHRSVSSPDIRTIRPQVPRSLRWVGCLLPDQEGADWLAEVASVLAEAPNRRTRRRFVRSYRCGVPRLIWTSWTEDLSGSRKLS